MSHSVVIGPHPEIAGVRVLARSSDDGSGPTVGLIGSVHGNETCGKICIDRLAEMAIAGELALETGRLVLIHGNPEASEFGSRNTEGGVDLNRLFDYAFEDTLPKKRWSYEHHRAVELRPLLQTLDAALDLHSATSPTPPFAIASSVPRSRELGRAIGLGYLTVGWEGPGLLGDKVLLQVLTERDKPSLAIECGHHEDPAAVDVALEVALRFLRETGLVSGSPSGRGGIARDQVLELEIVDAVKKPSPHFNFMRPLRGLDLLSSGEVIGGDANIEFRCKRETFVLMPNATVEVGKDMMYLAHRVGGRS